MKEFFLHNCDLGYVENIYDRLPWMQKNRWVGVLQLLLKNGIFIHF